MSSGFLQIPLDPETRHKAAIITNHGIWDWSRIPFGLATSPSAFQKTMARVLKDFNWKQVLIYVDDVLIVSDTFENHLKQLDQVFERLQIENLTLQPTKCKFAVKEVVYLRYIISKDGISTDPSKCEVIMTYPRPTNQKTG